MAASNQHFQKLSEEGFIQPDDIVQNERGRPSCTWRLKTDHKFFLGIAVEHHCLYFSLIDFADKEYFSHKIPLAEELSQQRFLEILEEGCELVLRQLRRVKGTVLQAFAGTSGFLAPDGTIIHNPNYPFLNGLKISDELERRFHIPCYNDAAAYIVRNYETHKLSSDPMILALEWGEGITAIVYSRNILVPTEVPASINRGQWNFGHIPIIKNGKPCHCGRRGCLEAYAGGLSLIESHPEWRIKSVSKLYEALKDGDPAVLEAVREAARIYARSLYWLIRIFGIRTFLFTGGILSKAFDSYEESFRSGLQDWFTDHEMKEFKFICSDFEMDHWGIGAALVAKAFFLNPEEMRKYRGIIAPPEKSPE